MSFHLLGGNRFPQEPNCSCANDAPLLIAWPPKKGTTVALMIVGFSHFVQQPESVPHHQPERLSPHLNMFVHQMMMWLIETKKAHQN